MGGRAAERVEGTAPREHHVRKYTDRVQVGAVVDTLAGGPLGAEEAR